MIASIEKVPGSKGDYWLASGEFQGRHILAEGATRKDAINEWNTAAAVRQAEIDGQRAHQRVRDWLRWMP